MDNNTVSYYSNPEFPERNIKTIGKWYENKKIQVEYVNSKGDTIIVLRRVYFDTHDLYITIQGKRYYYAEFN